MAHSIVYIILSVLSLVAVHAMSAPVNQPAQENHEPGTEDEDTTDSL